MEPTPADDGTLVDTGIYHVVRHPLYLTAVLISSAWALVTRTRAAVVGLAAALVFFHAKARYEEQLLEQRYPGYASYRMRVPSRIIPVRR
jgi:protein-S-isoprenylcysteine O-methyltransferase Ste14